MHADAENVGAHLDNPDSPAHELLRRAQRLGEIQRILREILRDWSLEPLAHSLRTANERDGVLIVYADSAAALTQVRYRRQDLLKALQERLAPAPEKLEIKMRPSAQSS